MKIIQPYFDILTPITGNELKAIEYAGRTCYKSECNITEESAKSFVKNLIKNGHEAMIEHSMMSVKFVCDRGVSHELVRHRLASFAQESTRYCNYSNDRFGNELTFIKPVFFDEDSEKYKFWKLAMVDAEESYFRLLNLGCSPQEARTVLPNSIKTEVIMTANYREWRHLFKLRAAGTTGKPHPQMEELFCSLFEEMRELIPVVFDDIYLDMVNKSK